MSITHSVCVFVALGIRNTMRMSHIVFCGLPRSTTFSTLSHKRHDFRKKKLLNIKCVFWVFVQLLFETIFILRTERDMIKYVYRSFIFSTCSWSLVFYRLWCVVVCDLETSWMRRPWCARSCSGKIKERKMSSIFYTEDGGNRYRRGTGKFLLDYSQSPQNK